MSNGEEPIVGRPTVMTPENISKLEHAFAQGLNDAEACFMADIGQSTFYHFCQENPEFQEKKEALKNNVKMKAKMNIAGEIENKNIPLSQWYLERKDKGFKIKTDITTDNEKITPIYNGLSIQKHDSNEKDFPTNEED